LRKSEIIKEALRVRDNTIIQLLLSGKVRYEELCELRIKDIDLDKSKIQVGKKKRRLNNKLVRIIFDYWIYGRPHLINKKNHDYFFVTRTGGPLNVD